jgi:hypothetical protein
MKPLGPCGIEFRRIEIGDWQVRVAQAIDTGNTNQLADLQAVLKKQQAALLAQKELQRESLCQQRLQLEELRKVCKTLSTRAAEVARGS